ncbi:uncharacterized protein LAJ45_04178 [Morchella importuna]|uniref:uncharacterized protein n=1 Tax=Morchella importuna TaxID=1174673 RepID=UPI001E8CF391|nr:uncharacterized protein LAJ45_04178 [Morchella importuna]KAH8151557.1 hypothetical protein LAJ45_04178 [Morchella importuna]
MFPSLFPAQNKAFALLLDRQDRAASDQALAGRDVKSNERLGLLLLRNKLVGTETLSFLYLAEVDVEVEAAGTGSVNSASERKWD